MSSPNDLAFWAVTAVACYKLVSLLTGLGFAYMGYRLFIAGIEKPAATLEASSGAHALKLSRTAPGTFFALFGTAVVCVTLYQGFDIKLPSDAERVLSNLPALPADLASGSEGGS
ncbi:hypothetical protein DEA8626_03374 [Defluviimonas aquaemixtae]|uniref:Uncharacterized protein n=1 Tax=Albidovulum aquaemixtae TaxID=1542388 RepID=A0A2R8BLW2_9RHOB|nr:hypothetical protein [Defluviimonas aquaemixtae]SPH24323.1 hypothetical protein DEA8626_03374 [Defluviimonas aquaemixtae]